LPKPLIRFALIKDFAIFFNKRGQAIEGRSRSPLLGLLPILRREAIAIGDKIGTISYNPHNTATDPTQIREWLV